MDKILKLLEAGYTKEEIEAMDKPKETSTNEGLSEDDMKSLDTALEEIRKEKEGLVDLKKSIQAANAANAEAQPDKKETTDDILKSLLG